MRQQRKSAQSKGFSLVEVVIAIGIVAILLTTFMAVFGPAQKNISRALGVADVSRLTSTLENEMSYLREGEDSYKDSKGQISAFEKAFQWVKNSDNKNTAVVVYQYLANPDNQNPDGTMQAISSSDVASKSQVPGVDYITQTVARRLDSDYLKDELVSGVVVGSVYAVKMTQLIENTTSGGLELGTSGNIVNADKSPAGDSGSYTSGYITFQGEFFQLNNNLARYVTSGGWDFDTMTDPVVTQNIAVRR